MLHDQKFRSTKVQTINMFTTTVFKTRIKKPELKQITS
jgi:hypothetical protein